MSRWELPANWQWAPIGEIAEVVGGGTPTANDDSNFDDHGTPWITPADLSGYTGEYIARGRRSLSAKGVGNSSAKLLPAGTVLFTSRAPIGYCVIASNDLTTNQGFKNFILYGGISPRYVRFYLLGSKEYAESLASGTTFKELSQSRACRLLIPVAPLEEQERIAAKLDTLQRRTKAASAALESVGGLIEDFRRSALAKAFKGELTTSWREKHPTTESGAELLQRLRSAQEDAATSHASETSAEDAGESDNSEGTIEEPVLPEIPDNWTWAVAEEIVEPGADIVYGILQPGENIPDGVLYLQARDIKDGVIQGHLMARTRPEIAQQYDRSTLRSGDVVLGIIRATKVAIIPEELDGISLSRGLARFRPSKFIRTDYLARWLASPFAQRWLHRRYRGIDMPGLNLRDVRLLPVPVAPLDEQKAIIERLSQTATPITALGNAIDAAVSRCDALNQAILEKAFYGKLVPQNENEEHGSVVVARAAEARKAAIEARKEKMTKDGKTRRSLVSIEVVSSDVQQFVRQAGQRAVTFEEIRRGLPHSYEDVKKAIFSLLRDGEASLVKRFNEEEKRMEFRRGGE